MHVFPVYKSQFAFGKDEVVSSNLASSSMFTRRFRCNLEKVESKVIFAGNY